MDASTWYSLVSVSSSAVALALAVYVVRKVPNRRAGDTFVIAMTFFLLAGTFAFLLRSSVNAPESLLLDYAHVFYFFHMLAVGFTAAFVGTYFYGFKAMGRRPVVLFLQISLFVVAIFVSTLVTDVGLWPPYGMTVDSTDATLALAVFATAYMSTALAVLVRTLIVNKDPIVRRQAGVMTLGIVVHGFGAESYAYLRIGAGSFPPPYLTVTALVMALSFAFAVARYKMFVVVPRKEERLALPRKFPIQPGRAYVVHEATPGLHLQALAESVRCGATGLVVSRRNPASVREDFDLPETAVLWVTETVGQNRVSPRSPAMLERLLDEFLRASPKAVVALDGIELFARESGSDRSVRLLEYVRDAVTGPGGTLLASTDPASAVVDLAHLIEREFEPLPVPPEEAGGAEDVFVIDSHTGILLARTSRASTMAVDADVMAGMLTAIIDFAKVSFAQGLDQLRRLELGEKSVVLEQSPRIIIAVVFAGKEPQEIHAELQAFLVRAEARYGTVLEGWNGDTRHLRGLESMAGRLLV